ncbi:MAG TPA: methyltransferase domain-containing protein, partial [Candidatus Kapabacteria bacterium]|nr:methyltransferase domain-containing protein [Candidatus Kapabacteria bacterium]
MRNIYDTIYSNEKNFGNLADSPRIRIMHSLLSKQGPYNKNILDIGCYDGTFLDYWQEKGNNLFGLDASGWAIERCLAKGIKAKTFFFDDVRPLPFEKSFFDFV